MKIIVLFSCFLALISSQTTFSYSGNVTINNNGDHKFRVSALAVVPVPPLGVVATYVSTGGAIIENGTVTANVIQGGIKFLTGTTPVSYISYYNESVNVLGVYPSQYNASVNLTGACVALAPIRIEEWNDTSLVRTVALKKLAWTTTNGKSGYLSYIQATATNAIGADTIKNGEIITMTFFVSSILGTVKMDILQAVVTPKSIESFITINGWRYETDTNYLKLFYGVGSGQISFNESVSVNIDTNNQHPDFRFGSGDGIYKVYTSFSKSAFIDDYTMPITVKYNFTQDITTFIDDLQTNVQLTGSYNGTASGTIVEVVFSAGAGKIIYDPTIGSGEPVQNPTGNNAVPSTTQSSTNSVTKIVFSILFLAVVFLLF